MCGILGLIAPKKLIAPAQFDAARDTLRHRGPDGSGSWYAPDNGVMLGHRRLSFLDLSPNGKQPMCNEDESIWVVFNGEIYNYLELKQQLVERGHVFTSHTDSEVLIHGYEEWGIQLLPYLKGMFAFGIWDQNTQTLLLARDRFGIKPLYYSQHNTATGPGFSFASELKAIVAFPFFRKELDYSALFDFLNYRFIPSPKSVWKNTYKLSPGHYLKVRISDCAVGGAFQQIAYWHLSVKDQFVTSEEAIVKMDACIQKSVQEHLRSDVPIGLFLSGGYDSSALATYLRRTNYNFESFTIGFEGWNKSEHKYAAQVAEHLGIPNHCRLLSVNEFQKIADLAYFYDEPFADPSIAPTYFVSKLARKHVKAVFSGEGADELFVGYDWQKRIGGKKHSSLWSMVEKLVGALFFKPSSVVDHYAKSFSVGRIDRRSLIHDLHPDLRQYAPARPDWFYQKQFRNSVSPLKSVQYLDLYTFMAEMVLTKVDRASMANSLEVRVPFLDHELVSYLFSLAPEVYYRADCTKFLLRTQIQSDLPPTILNRTKQGFRNPKDMQQNEHWCRRQLKEGTLIKTGIFADQAIEARLEQQDYSRLWKLLILELWWKEWMND